MPKKKAQKRKTFLVTVPIQFETGRCLRETIRYSADFGGTRTKVRAVRKLTDEQIVDIAYDSEIDMRHQDADAHDYLIANVRACLKAAGLE